ncbi:questin oxidase family protein [Iamia sp. SCSIO 61187]|uniref:hypothetical protein n=1 Tax=Iamia sp. SCSIO 61187 TaxID=2722752 RepID=UPI001C62952B|nr:hypothetical protein [Iamia sp. SCSIO 61187]QYG94071.1 questin oxidase family protein [Iamia sp. SCSIO 61187]
MPAPRTSPAAPPRPRAAADPTGISRPAALEAALELLPGDAFLDGPGMAVHGPMGAEALSGLGHDDLVVAWVEAYRQRHRPHSAPPRVARLDADAPDTWRAALGDRSRLGDWRDLFDAELAEAPWSEVVATWVPRLVDGYGGFLTHGLLRTAHAVRILEALPAVDPPRVALHELAMGLAFWAGTYQPLPGRIRLDGDASLAEAMARIPRATGPWGPVERAFFEPLAGLEGFAPAVESLGPPWTPDPLGDLTLAFARALVAHPEAPTDALVHTVTPIVAARTLLPHVPARTVAHVYAAAWQVGAGILACFTPDRPVDVTRSPAGEPLAPPELVARAVENRAPHAVKMTEACLQEHALRPDPAYLLAAGRAVAGTEPW